jgi:hypothetical protein
LHDLRLFLFNHLFLLGDLPYDISPCGDVFLGTEILHLGLLKALLLLQHLGLELLLLLLLVLESHSALFVLGPNKFSLLRFLFLMEVDGIFNLCLFHFSLSFLLQDSFSILGNFLLLESLLLYFNLNFLVIFLFEYCNVLSSLFSLFYLFPGFHLLLL